MKFKRPIIPNQYIKICPYDVIKFGLSTRLYIARNPKLEVEPGQKSVPLTQNRKSEYLKLTNKV